MRNESQTLVGSFRAAVNEWRRREGWSREAIAQHIADQYHASEGPRITGIKFDPNTKDIYQRAHVNADRIFRWLDDDTKDTNLLPANFLPYLLAIVPLDLRIKCVNEFLLPAGLSVRVRDSDIPEDLVKVLQQLARETGEATASLADLLDGATPEEVANAEMQVTEAMEACKVALDVINKLRVGS